MTTQSDGGKAIYIGESLEPEHKYVLTLLLEINDLTAKLRQQHTNTKLLVDQVNTLSEENQKIKEELRKTRHDLTAKVGKDTMNKIMSASLNNKIIQAQTVTSNDKEVINAEGTDNEETTTES